MIVRNHLPVARIWPHVSKRIGALFLFDLAIAILYTQFEFRWLAISSLPLAMIGGALSVFLAFRNNSAYDRWWEARALWGSLVNTARTFSRQILTLADAVDNNDDREQLVELQIAYVHTLRCHLRKQNPFPELERSLPATSVAYLRGQRNVPAGMLFLLAQNVRKLFDAGRLDSIRFSQIDSSLTDLCNVQGACERIKNTPLPRQYEYLPRLLVGLFSLLLPFGLVEGMGLPAWGIHALGSAFLAGRMLHAYGISQEPEVFRFRTAGMGLTFTVLGVGAAALLGLVLAEALG